MRISDWSSDVCSSDLRLRADGATAIYIAVNGKAAGVIAIADPVKETTGEALAALREAGIKVIMHTGANREVGRAACMERVCQSVSVSGVNVILKEKIDDLITYF